MLTRKYFSVCFDFKVPKDVKIKNFTEISMCKFAVICHCGDDGFLNFYCAAFDGCKVYTNSCLGEFSIPPYTSIENIVSLLKKYVSDNIFIGNNPDQLDVKIKIYLDFNVDTDFPFPIMFRTVGFMENANKYIFSIDFIADDICQSAGESFIFKRQLSFDDIETGVEAILETIYHNKIHISKIKSDDEKKH